jgi:hypothetical protein
MKTNFRNNFKLDKTDVFPSREGQGVCNKCQFENVLNLVATIKI